MNSNETLTEMAAEATHVLAMRGQTQVIHTPSPSPPKDTTPINTDAERERFAGQIRAELESEEGPMPDPKKGYKPPRGRPVHDRCKFQDFVTEAWRQGHIWPKFTKKFKQQRHAKHEMKKSMRPGATAPVLVPGEVSYLQGQLPLPDAMPTMEPAITMESTFGGEPRFGSQPALVTEPLFEQEPTYVMGPVPAMNASDQSLGMDPTLGRGLQDTLGMENAWTLAEPDTIDPTLLRNEANPEIPYSEENYPSSFDEHFASLFPFQ